MLINFGGPKIVVRKSVGIPAPELKKPLLSVSQPTETARERGGTSTTPTLCAWRHCRPHAQHQGPGCIARSPKATWLPAHSYRLICSRALLCHSPLMKQGVSWRHSNLFLTIVQSALSS